MPKQFLEFFQEQGVTHLILRETMINQTEDPNRGGRPLARPLDHPGL